MDNIDNIMQLCRLCLVKDQVNVPIFGGTNDIEEISSKISSCLPVKVSPDDSLPKKICDDCSYKLDLLYVFRNTSINSEKQLYQWLEQAGISKTTSGTISTTQSLTTPILATDSTIPSVPISTLDTVINDTITKSEISVKQEKTESTAGSELSAETQEYLLQQQKLPYQENFGDFNTTGTNSATAETEEPARKKPRRAAASKPPIKDNESDPDVPPTKAEDDSDEDIDDAGDGGGMDDDDDEEEEEEDDGLDHPEFVDVPSTSAEEQPGPSGVNKDPIAAPVDIQRLRPRKVDPVKRILIRMSEKQIKCLYCPKLFKNQSRLESHLLVHSDVRPYHCEICKRKFKSSKSLRVHRCNNDDDSENKTIKHECNICGKKFRSFAYLKLHHQRHLHQFKYTCEICGYGCLFKCELEQHRDRVHIHKHTICNICGLTFTTQHINRHLLLHEEGYSENRNFECKFCKKKFTQMKYVRDHIRRIHEDKQHKHICNVCNKEFSNGHGLKRHKRLHDTAKLNECRFCGKKFHRKNTLIQHIRTHTGERPYICNVCNKGFTQKTPLRNHMRLHSGEKPYSCNICCTNFFNKSTLSIHMQNKHKAS